MRFFAPVFITMTVAVLFVGTMLDLQRQKVTEASVKDVAEKMIIDCLAQNRDRFSGKKDCYFNGFENIAYQHGHPFAFAVLHEVQTQDQDTLSCHLIAHSIGEGAFRKNPGDWETQVDTISQSCTYGAIHGTLEAYAATLKQGFSKELLQRVCQETSPGSCWHILGHLTLLVTQGNLPDALDICSVFKKESQRFSCLTGAFMENITELNLISHEYRKTKQKNTPKRLEELASLCSAHEETQQRACWKEIVHAAPTELRENPEQFFAFCASAKDKKAGLLCKLHAVNILNSKYKYHLPSLKSLCATGGIKDADFEQQCYPYVARTTLLMVPEKLPEVISFCETLQEQFRADCHDATNSFLRSRPANEREKLQEACLILSQQEQEYCKERVELE
jgi:hypothetical protein